MSPIWTRRYESLPAPPEVALRDPRAVRWLLALGRPLLWFFRAEVRGLDALPRRPTLFVGNHSGGMGPGDGVFLLAYLRAFGCRRRLYVLVHPLLVKLPGMRRALARLGMLEATPRNACAALLGGGDVLVYPGGDHDSLRPFAHRRRVDFGGRSSFVRVATDLGVPLVPVVTAGSHATFLVLAQGKALARRLGLPRFGLHSFPLILCLPWIVAVGPMCLLPYFPFPSRIRVRIDRPFELRYPSSRSSAASCAARLCERMDSLLAREATP